MKRDFKGVWIPKIIWCDTELSWMEKLFLTEIDSLDQEKGCFASNRYFSKFFHVTPQRCSQVINNLINKSKLNSETEYDGKRIVKRTLRVVNKFSKGYQINLPGYQINAKVNNTVNNTKIISDPRKEDRKVLKALFFLRYQQKAKEIKGTDLTPDGKTISPAWAAKESTLLKADCEEHGHETLRSYVELFFSDKVKEVAAFCRIEQKAGYNYSVFHGMIGKLSMSKVKIGKPCPECGKISGHLDGCSIYDTKIKAEIQEKIDIRNEIESSGNVDLMGDFKKVLEKRHA